MKFGNIISLFTIASLFALIRAASKEIISQVYLDIYEESDFFGRIVIGLYDKIVPKTTQNFIQLATKQPGYGYEGSEFHRIIGGFMMQGGDFTNGDGTGGKSAAGKEFPDENFKIKHEPGVIAMANRGKNTNGSQFYITFAPTPHLDGKHVVFGKVIEGLDVVKKVEGVKTKADRPVKKLYIKKCGLLSQESAKTQHSSDEL